MGRSGKEGNGTFFINYPNMVPLGELFAAKKKKAEVLKMINLKITSRPKNKKG